MNESDKTLIIDKAKLRSETTATADEAEAPQPSRLKRLLLRLRNKWVWIPTISLAAVGIISWVVVVMLHTTHEKERLQAEEALGIDASDCVVKDTKTVAENLKNCITGFNQAIASAPAKTKKP